MIQRRTLLGATAVAPLAALTGCASQNLAGYASEKPVLDLTQYFNGTVDAHGIFQGRSGQIARRFTVVMECSWRGNEGVLDEETGQTGWVYPPAAPWHPIAVAAMEAQNAELAEKAAAALEKKKGG